MPLHSGEVVIEGDGYQTRKPACIIDRVPDRSSGQPGNKSAARSIANCSFRPRSSTNIRKKPSKSVVRGRTFGTLDTPAVNRYVASEHILLFLVIIESIPYLLLYNVRFSLWIEERHKNLALSSVLAFYLVFPVRRMDLNLLYAYVTTLILKLNRDSSMQQVPSQ
jgi:hypothetical protein